MPTSEEEIREMIALLDRYKAQLEMLTGQLNLLQTTESELILATEFLEVFPDQEEGDDILVPVGAGILVPARLASTDKVLASIGSGLQSDMTPGDAKEHIDQRLQRIREMIQQTSAGLEQTEASANALSSQLEVAYQEYQAQMQKAP
jgi:prefoldin alpha subunit